MENTTAYLENASDFLRSTSDMLGRPGALIDYSTLLARVSNGKEVFRAIGQGQHSMGLSRLFGQRVTIMPVREED